jgi:hypothetical protein
MKEDFKFILLGILIVFVLGLLFFMYQMWTTSIEDSRVTEVKVNTQLKDIPWYSTAYKIAFVAILIVCLVSILILSYGIARSRLKKSSVYTFKIGKYNEIAVHEKDLSIAAPIAMGLMKAEQLKQKKGKKVTKEAFKLANQIVEGQAQQIQALVGKRGVSQLTTDTPMLESEQAQAALPAFQTGQVPTFQALLTTGEIAPHKPMILGYENGEPRRGSFLDIYSAAVAGESGSGKTATLLFLIGSGLVACGVKFIAIDPHYPHPKSLGYKTKPLWEEGLMRIATNKDDMLAVLAEVERIIDNRLRQIDKDTTPVVLVIDELAFLSKTSIGSALAHTMERISTEGRKCDVYMLASSQTWLASRTGDSSVVRDTLTSAYVHRIKPKQANLLLQDKDEAEKVKRFIKQPGDVLFCPVNDESTICKMPYTTEADMMMVAEMMSTMTMDIPFKQVNDEKIPALANTSAQAQQPESSSQSAEKMIAPPKPLDASLLTVEVLREQMTMSPLDPDTWQKQLAEASGISDSLLQKILDGKHKLSAKTAKKLAPYLMKNEE